MVEIRATLVEKCAFFRHFIHTHSPFYPKLGMKMVEFLDGVFEPDVRMNGASFAPNRMLIHRMVWPQLTIVTHLLTHLLSYNTVITIAITLLQIINNY
jgi:hypothetical protein